MQARIQRWGNSLAVRLPSAVATKAGLAEGTAVEVKATAHGIVVRPVHRYDLGELLAGVSADNLHGDVSTGPRVGREEW